MTINILMPALSPTMTDGKLSKWYKAEGDEVASGDVIAEIETDKATMEVEAADDGVLGKIVVAEGTEGVPVNQVIAVLLEEGEDASAAEGAAASAPAPAAPAAAPEPEAASAAEPAPQPAPQPAAAPQKPAPRPTNGGRILASPLARRLATEAGLDLAAIAGSGPHGRIVKRDIDAAQAGGAAARAPEAPAAEAPKPAEAPRPQLPEVIAAEFTEIPHSSMRKTIAARLTESARDIPHFYLTIDCTIDSLLAMRKDLNGRAEAAGEDYKISVNDFIVRAVALALRKVPEVNASWTDEAIRQFTNIDVCVAVALPGGLITPIVKNADRKGLAMISREVKDLAIRAKEGKLQPEEYQGGGFTISNLGMYGIKHFTGIINPPQACILAVGAGEQRPVVKDGALAAATVMTVTMSCDHRVVDGALGATFLQAFKVYVEDPLTMLL